MNNTTWTIQHEQYNMINTTWAIQHEQYNMNNKTWTIQHEHVPIFSKIYSLWDSFKAQTALERYGLGKQLL